jgi:hypothetical protein
MTRAPEGLGVAEAAQVDHAHPNAGGVDQDVPAALQGEHLLPAACD